MPSKKTKDDAVKVVVKKAAPKKDAPKRGKPPTVYTEEIGEKMFLGFCNGESLRTICEADDMPHKATIFRWLADPEHPICDHYTRGREIQAESLVDDIQDIADNGTNDWMERQTRKGTITVVNTEAIQRSRLRMDARKWVAGKIKPKKYGTRIQADVAVSPLEEMSDEQLQAAAIALVSGLGLDPSAIAGLGADAPGSEDEAGSEPPESV